MTTTMNGKGQVTIPKKVRDALHLGPGDCVDFDIKCDGQVMIRKTEFPVVVQSDRFEAARGKAQIKWRTDDLMALLRGLG